LLALRTERTSFNQYLQLNHELTTMRRSNLTGLTIVRGSLPANAVAGYSNTDDNRTLTTYFCKFNNTGKNT